MRAKDFISMFKGQIECLDVAAEQAAMIEAYCWDPSGPSRAAHRSNNIAIIQEQVGLDKRSSLQFEEVYNDQVEIDGRLLASW